MYRIAVVLMTATLALVCAGVAQADKISKAAAVARARAETTHECQSYETPDGLPEGRWHCWHPNYAGPYCFSVKNGWNCAIYFVQYVPRQVQRACSAGLGLHDDGDLAWITVTACVLQN